jgi:hypothetical protein
VAVACAVDFPGDPTLRILKGWPASAQATGYGALDPPEPRLRRDRPSFAREDGSSTGLAVTITSGVETHELKSLFGTAKAVP